MSRRQNRKGPNNGETFFPKIHVRAGPGWHVRVLFNPLRAHSADPDLRHNLELFFLNCKENIFLRSLTCMIPFNLLKRIFTAPETLK